MRWSKGPKQHNFPLLALSYNHRRAALYQAHAIDAQHPSVQMALKQGLQRCRILHKNTPDYVVQWLCQEHNRYHAGSGATVSAVIQEAMGQECRWKKKCCDEGITTRLPNYQKRYDDFVRSGSGTFSDSVKQFQEAKILGHSLQSYDLLGAFEDGFGVKQISLPGCQLLKVC